MLYTIKFMQWLLAAVKLAVSVALKDDEIKGRIINYGYNEEALNAGMVLCKNAEKLLLTRNALYGEQSTISTRLRKKIDALYRYYMKYVKLVRKTLKRDRDALMILGLNSQRPKTVIGLIEKSKQFFQYVLSDQGINERIKKFSITQQTMDTGQTLIDALEQDKEFHAIKMSEAQDTTVQRNETFQALYDWWSEFRQAAINSCEDRPQILERMKITAHVMGYRKPKKTESPEPPDPTEPPIGEPPAVVTTTNEREKKQAATRKKRKQILENDKTGAKAAVEVTANPETTEKQAAGN